MARARDLAALAGLAGLAYAMRNKGMSEDAGEQKTSSYTKDTKKVEAGDFKPTNESSYTPGNTGTARSGVGDATNNPLPKSPKSITPKDKAAPAVKDETTVTPSSRTTPGGNEKRVEGRKPMPSLKAVEQKAAARQTSMATDAMKNASRSTARRANLSPIDQIPGQDRSGPTGGERVTGTELGRNVSNTMSALTPLGGGVGKIGAEMATSGRAQRAYNAAQAERRAAEGMSPAEAIAAKQAAVQAARDAKTLNPNAWLAGPKGMAENFRRGGAVKMASGGMTASRRGDGIASRGKTRGKIC